MSTDKLEKLARNRAVKGWAFRNLLAEETTAIEAFLAGGECPDAYVKLYALARAQLGLEKDPCDGSGKKWGSGTGIPICPVCHLGPRSLKTKRPIRRLGKWTGKVPDHDRRES